MKKISPTLHESCCALAVFIYLMLIEPVFFANVLEGRTAYFVQVIAILFCIINIVQYNKKIKMNSLRQYLLFALPYLILIVHSVMLVYWNHTMSMSGVFINSMYWIIPIVLSFFIFTTMGSSGVSTVYYSILLNYTAVIFKVIIVKGIEFVFNIKTYTGTTGGYLEVHMVGLILPMFLIYYIFCHFEYGQPIGFSFFVGLLYSLMVAKRIALFGLAVAVIAYAVIKIIQKFKEINYKILVLVSLAIVALCYTYVTLLKRGIVDYYVAKYNIDTMTRIETWNAFSNYYTLSSDFEGKGIGFSMEKLALWKGVFAYGDMQNVGDMHNDILKIYLEAGYYLFFVFFLCFFTLNLIYYIKKQYTKTAVFYFIMSIYSFLLMVTDNILRYTLFLVFFYLSVVVIQSKEKNSLNESLNK